MSKAQVSKNDFFNTYQPVIPNHFENENNYAVITQIKMCFNCGAFNPKYQYICGMCKSKNIRKINAKYIKLIKRDFFES